MADVLVEYKGYYLPLDSVPTEIMDEWEATLKGERARILAALQEKIPNADAFITKLANPAHERWAAFVAPDWEDRDFILLKHRIKLKGAYDSWNTGISNAFAEGGTFEQNVTSKKEKFQLARYPMGAVGIKYKTAWGPAYKAIAVLSGDTRVTRYMTANDSFNGSVQNVFLAGATRFARAIAVPAIVQGLVLAQYAHEEGLASERDAVISATNSKLANTVLKMVDTSAYVVTLEIGYDDVADKLYAYAKAETPAT